MNLSNYLENPAGKGAVIAGKRLMIEDLNRRFKELVMSKKVQMNVFTHKGDYVFHFIIPTESEDRDNTYDVLIHFSSDIKTIMIDNTLKNYDVQFFSNCPSFTYTYAYAYKMEELLLDDLANKYDVKVLKTPPLSRNPSVSVSYEKSLYFACKYLIDDISILNKSELKKIAKKLPSDYYKKEIRNTDRIDFEIKQSKVRIKEEKKKATSKAKPSRDKGKTLSSKSTLAKDKPNVNMISAKKPSKPSSVGTIKPRKAVKKR